MTFGADAFCSGGIGWFHWPSGCVPQARGLVGLHRMLSARLRAQGHAAFFLGCAIRASLKRSS